MRLTEPPFRDVVRVVFKKGEHVQEVSLSTAEVTALLSAKKIKIEQIKYTGLIHDTVWLLNENGASLQVVLD